MYKESTLDLIEKIEAAGAAEKLLSGTIANVKEWAGADFLPEWTRASIAELVDKGEWDELNDRFYRNLAFGTGGIRGRTMGKVVTAAELGTPSQMGTPEYAAAGSNMLNDFNIVRATVGLFRYVKS